MSVCLRLSNAVFSLGGLVVGLVLLLGGLSSCRNPAEELVRQLEAEDKALEDYARSQGWAYTRQPMGYYLIDRTRTSQPTLLLSTTDTHQVASVNYRLYLLGGQRVDSLMPHVFAPGVGAYYAPLADVVTQLRKGDKVTMLIPSRLMFWQNSPVINGIPIPAYSSFRMEVEMNDARTLRDQIDHEIGLIRARFAPDTVTRLDSGVYYLVRSAGTGPLPPTNAQFEATIVTRFVDGTRIDSVANVTLNPAFTTSFPQAIFTGLRRMREGERGTLALTSRQAYWSRGLRPHIHPFSPLLYDIRLHRIR